MIRLLLLIKNVYIGHVTVMYVMWIFVSLNYFHKIHEDVGNIGRYSPISPPTPGFAG